MATLRARVRWVRGDPNFLLRIRGQWIECAGQMTLPTNLGTPGAPNSRRVSNAGPAIYDVMHSPGLPAASEPVVVTARVSDPDGLASLTLRYRLDPSRNFIGVLLNDDGTGGDAVPGDGVCSGTIPGYPAGTLVAFHVRATDASPSPAATTFPNDAPFRGCLVRFGETNRARHNRDLQALGHAVEPHVLGGAGAEQQRGTGRDVRVRRGAAGRL
jgi:hypothetical protein